MKQKLIDQLLHKAGARFGAEGTDYSDFTSSKFVELIVAECVQICKTVNSVKVVNAPDTYQEGREMGSFMCMEEIKKHFGVER